MDTTWCNSSALIIVRASKCEPEFQIEMIEPNMFFYCWICRPCFGCRRSPSSGNLACSRLRDGGGKSFSNKKCEKRATAPFPKSCASYFRFARFNTFPLYYLRAWMTDRPADARAFSRPTSKATEKRPGVEVGKIRPYSAMVAKNWACS